MNENKENYWGFDLGTNSIGWAVTNSDYELERAKGKDLWGVFLFSEAETSAQRRSFRIARRRRQREIARMGELRKLFEEEINKVDPGFYARLDDSFYHIEDRTEGNHQKYALFADNGYTDEDYFKQYPTIFHLRKELIDSKEPHDVRLVYLALANLFKRRGNFLSQSLDGETEENTIQDAYDDLCDQLELLDISFPKKIDCEELEKIIGAKGISKKDILNNLCTFMNITKKDKAQYNILSLMCGLTVKLVNIFPEAIDADHKQLSLCYRSNNYEEESHEVEEYLGSELFEVLISIKTIHDKGLLYSIMKGYHYLSQARVASYEEHKRDLNQLKAVLKKYDQKAYNQMFRIMKAGNYSAYIGSVNSSSEKSRRINEGRDKKDLYKTIKGYLSKLPKEDEDVQEILARIEADIFLPKQLTSENGVIPNQIHLKEMKKILSNAESYLSFLKQKDETNLSISDKIIQLFTFTIPYFVGPLGQQFKDQKGYNVWAELKSDASGKIYPWNFDKMVDLETTAEKFISRMVRQCTYLTGKTVLPKNSLLYEKFEVLNELNNLKINGEKISVEIKQDIYNTLFKQGKKVTWAKLVKYFVANNIIGKEEENLISGIDKDIKASLGTIGKFYGILKDGVYEDNNKNMIEDIVFWETVYGNDKKFLKNKIQNNYPNLFTKDELKKIIGFKFNGWGKLSKEFLLMEGISKEDGVVRSLIQALWETNNNIMELLSTRFTYTETLNELLDTAEKPLKEWTIEDLDDMYLSTPVKRMVWNTLSISKELVSVAHQSPKKIFVEMARENGEKGVRTVSRKNQILELYNALKKEGAQWQKEIENRSESDFRIKKLYLYYKQMGRCMYTNEVIDIEELMKENSTYDIDHIYPRSLVKDDSLENNLVLVKKSTNNIKDNNYPLDKDIQKNCYSLWKMLLDKGFINNEKFNRLTRTHELTEEEKAAFINRQLVETRQGTKAITQILQRAFPDTEIIFSKASLVSDFRHKFGLEKVRCVNNLHHANDAYLNIVVGNVYNVKFTKSPLNYIRDAEKEPYKEENKYHMDKIFLYNVSRNGEIAWNVKKGDKVKTIDQVKKVLNKNSILVTRQCVEKHGSLTGKTTIWNKEKAEGVGYIPVKMNDARLADVTKYGGLTSVSIAGYSLVEYEVKGKIIRSLESIPVYLGKGKSVKELDEELLLQYITDILQSENKKDTVKNIRIIRKMIPSGSLIKYNGFLYCLGGKTENRILLKNAVEPVYKQEDMIYVKKIEKAVTNNNYLEKDKKGDNIITSEKNLRFYDSILNKYEHSIYKYQLGVMKDKLSSGREQFISLDIAQQCYVLLQIINNLRTGDGVDLVLIGGSKGTGRNKINKKLSNAEEVVLITQSITGLFKKEIDLLK